MTANTCATRKNRVDPDDAPELTDAFFERADEYHGGTLIKRGRGHPKAKVTKVAVKLRLAPICRRPCGQPGQVGKRA